MVEVEEEVFQLLNHIVTEFTTCAEAPTKIGKNHIWDYGFKLYAAIKTQKTTMVKRKAECSPCLVPDTELPGPECDLPKDSSHPAVEMLVAGPTEVEVAGEATTCHVSQSPATVADEENGVADRFWSLLAAVGYQVW